MVQDNHEIESPEPVDKDGGVKVQFEVEEKAGYISVRNEIQEILVSLVDNSVTQSEENGIIEVVGIETNKTKNDLEETLPNQLFHGDFKTDSNFLRKLFRRGSAAPDPSCLPALVQVVRVEHLPEEGVTAFTVCDGGSLLRDYCLVTRTGKQRITENSVLRVEAIEVLGGGLAEHYLGRGSRFRDVLGVVESYTVEAPGRGVGHLLWDLQEAPCRLQEVGRECVPGHSTPEHRTDGVPGSSPLKPAWSRLQEVEESVPEHISRAHRSLWSLTRDPDSWDVQFVFPCGGKLAAHR